MRRNLPPVERRPRFQDATSLIAAVTLSVATLLLIGDLVFSTAKPMVALLVALPLAAQAATLVLHARR